MKNLLVRCWNGLFPIPPVSAPEAFLLRALFAAALFWFFPISIQIHSQPEPVGLAHWFDLTWLSDAGVFPVYRAVFFGLLVLYAAGFFLPVTLPLMTLVHILPATLHNSQGFTFHGNQILSLTLLGLSGMTLWFSFTDRSETRTGSGLVRRLMPPAIAFIEAMLIWKTEQRFTLVALCSHLSPGADAFVVGWGNAFLFVAAFLALAAVPSAFARAWTDEGAPSPVVRSWTLVMAQFVIASAYLISVFSKMIRSDGQWLVNGHRQGTTNFYTFFRRSDAAWVRSSGYEVHGWDSGDLRCDPAPCWNRDNRETVFPAIANDGTRQMFRLRLKPGTPP